MARRARARRRAAYRPALVAREQLLAANSGLKAAEAATEGAAFASAGWLVQWLGAPLALLVDAASFVASALLISGIRGREETEPREARAAPRLELAAGLREIAATPWLRRIALASWLRAFGHQVVGVVYMLYVTRELGFAPGPLGLVFAVGAASSFDGAFAAERAGARFGPGRAMAGGLALAGTAIALLPLAPAASAAGLALLVLHQLGDGADVLYDVNERSLRQGLVASERLGRVSGSLRVGELGAMLLASAVGGGLGETFGLRAALLAGAAGLGLGALVVATSAGGRDTGIRSGEECDHAA